MTSPSPPVEPPTSIGGVLKAAREERRLTVDDISARTRIRGTLIRDIEEDRYASSGGDVYARGHLRAIAAVVGADGDALLARFDAEAGSRVQPDPLITLPVVRAPTQRIVIPTASAPERHGPRWPLAGFAALAIFVIVIVAGSLLGTGPSSLTSDPLAGPSATPKATSTPALKAKPVSRPRPPGAWLRVKGVQSSSWISVRAGQRLLFEGLVRKGEVKEFSDPVMLRLVMGNAGALRLRCGDRDVGSAGAIGQVRRLSCNAKGDISP
ncbi:MAG TPA: RodZ domain-containing protein [Mycobacteriales bacterium]|nr:RodZ domain-containing protein [Mycobacteriales bacterium]